MNTLKKIQVVLLVILGIAILSFCYLMYSWNFAYSRGTFVSEDGTYKGEFIGMMFEGEGTFSFSIGAEYKGQWEKGKMEGHGVLTFKNGSKYEGEFKNGYYHGEGKITTENGRVVKGIWEKGKLIKSQK